MPDDTLVRLTKKNLLYTISSVVGSDLFRHIYVRRQLSGEEFDALENGDLACAYVVSGILALHGLIDHPHATVATTLQRMKEAGWHSTDAPMPGTVVVWPPDLRGNDHIGFCLDEQTFMSNSSAERHPVLHGKALSDGREPTSYFTHDTLR